MVILTIMLKIIQKSLVFDIYPTIVQQLEYSILQDCNRAKVGRNTLAIKLILEILKIKVDK